MKAKALRKKMISSTGTPRSAHAFTIAARTAMRAMARTRRRMPRAGLWATGRGAEGAPAMGAGSVTVQIGKGPQPMG